MKQKTDRYTVDMFEKNHTERLRKQDSKTITQRMAAYRKRNKFNMLVSMPQDEGLEGR